MYILFCLLYIHITYGFLKHSIWSVLFLLHHSLSLSPLFLPEKFRLVSSCAPAPTFCERGPLHGWLENSPSLQALSTLTFFEWCEARFLSWMMVSLVTEGFSPCGGCGYAKWLWSSLRRKLR